MKRHIAIWMMLVLGGIGIRAQTPETVLEAIPLLPADWDAYTTDPTSIRIILRSTLPDLTFRADGVELSIRADPLVARYAVTIPAGADNLVITRSGSRPVAIPLMRSDLGKRFHYEVRLQSTWKTAPGRVMIAAEPANARIIIDSIGLADRNSWMELPTGNHVVTVSADGHLTERRLLHVAPKSTHRHEVVLLPDPMPTATLDVLTEGDASIWVNGRMVAVGSTRLILPVVRQQIEVRQGTDGRSKVVYPQSGSLAQWRIRTQPDRNFALGLGLMIPGAGHLYAGRVEGILLAGAVAVPMVFGFNEFQRQQALGRDYDAAYAAYMSAVEPDLVRRNRRAAEAIHSQQVLAYRWMWAGFIAAGSIHLAQAWHLNTIEPRNGWRTEIGVSGPLPTVRVSW